MALNAQTIAKRWLAGVQSQQAKDKYIESVDNVNVHPGELAAAQQEKMKANINAAIESGLWANRVKRGTVADWKNRTKTKGAPRLGTGAQASYDKYQEGANKMVSTWQEIKETCRGMPSTTMAEKLAKVQYSIEQQKKAVGKTY